MLAVATCSRIRVSGYGTAGSHDTPEWLEAPSNPGLVVSQPFLERHSFSQLLKILWCLRQHLQRRPAT